MKVGRIMRVRTGRCLVVGAACALAGGCAGGHTAAGSAAAVVRITERDFHIAASVHHLRAGLVAFTVHNQGPDDHELIVVRDVNRHVPLPLRHDGVTVNEEKLAPLTVGSGLEPGQPDSVRSLRVRFTPGRYVIFCNMAGHYLGGMHTELVVR
jgi:uncharacterized cupredoxin-like copper-binding protein